MLRFGDDLISFNPSFGFSGSETFYSEIVPLPIM